MSTADLPGLLGRRIDDPTVLAFLHDVDPATDVARNDEGELRWISYPAGMVVYSDDESARITTVFLYAEGHEGAGRYRGPLPYGLDFAMSQEQVRASLPRPPDFAGDGYDSWDWDDHRLVVDYRGTGTIAMVTVTGDF
jgi:hypothetical protein